jgi:hypothetical protein
MKGVPELREAIHGLLDGWHGTDQPLEQEEVSLEEIFDFIDVNGDGFLDLEEVPY